MTNLVNATSQISKEHCHTQGNKHTMAGTVVKGARKCNPIMEHNQATEHETGVKLYQKIGNRTHIAWIARLRTGHCPLNKYLHRFNIIEDPLCDCGEAIETVAHFLLNC